jgi:hypothetical protein
MSTAAVAPAAEKTANQSTGQKPSVVDKASKDVGIGSIFLIFNPINWFIYIFSFLVLLVVFQQPAGSAAAWGLVLYACLCYAFYRWFAKTAITIVPFLL